MEGLYMWKQSLIFFYSSGENNISKFKITFFNLFGKFIWTTIKKELLELKASKGKWVYFTGTCMCVCVCLKKSENLSDVSIAI